MTSAAISEISESLGAVAEPTIALKDVGVRYRLPSNRTRSLKEFILLRMRGQLAFDDFWALRNTSLTVSAGECLGVIGRNGAGKTTMLQVIARVVPPTEGEVRVRGRVAPLLQLGAGFDQELTGRENIYLNGALLGMERSDISARFDEIVDFAELGGFIGAPLRTYSSGMAARLGFAVATACEPDILLVDEVLSVGDEAFKEKCLARMREFAARGTTMILVSHDPQMIRQFCTRVVWIEGKTVAVSGDPEEAMGAYHLFLTRGRVPTTLTA
jgi:ABC-type polysaccharide/polyol phosphate transport system ATPase subunit